MKSNHNKDIAIAGAIASVGLAVGAAMFAAFLSNRHKNAPDDDAPDYTARRKSGSPATVVRTLTIAKPRRELYDYWRNFGNLPPFMENVERIERKGRDGERSVWTIKAPAGTTVEIETEITRDEPGREIAWRSVEGSDIETEGRVTFEDAPGDRGTRVGLVIAYNPPAGALGRTIAKMFRREPEIQARHDLKRFKMLMETGEIATSARRKEETRKAKQESE